MADSSGSVCYYSANGSLLQSPSYVLPCGTVLATSGFTSCCDTQSNNICLSNSLCYNPNSPGGAYYLSSCTDPTYSAPECPKYCSNRVDKNELNVIYDSQARLWRCCSTNSDGTPDCVNPTHETFDEPAPRNLSVIYPSSASNPAGPSSSDTESNTALSSVPLPGAVLKATLFSLGNSVALTASDISSTASDTSSTASGTSTNSAYVAYDSGNTLAAGAIAGIAVGSVVFAASVLVTIYFLRRWYLKRRSERSNQVPAPSWRGSVHGTVLPDESISLAAVPRRSKPPHSDVATTLPVERDPNHI